MSEPDSEEDLQLRIARLENELGRAEARLAVIRSSTSFRITIFVLRLIKRVRLGRLLSMKVDTDAPVDRSARRVLVVAVAHNVEGVKALVATVARVLPSGVRVLFLVSCDEVSVFGTGGFQYEYVPSVVDYERHFPGQDYAAFLAERLADIRRWFRPDTELVIGDDETTTVLESVLRSSGAEAQRGR